MRLEGRACQHLLIMGQLSQLTDITALPGEDACVSSTGLGGKQAKWWLVRDHCEQHPQSRT